jgi:zinc-ribbon domain
MTAAALVCGSCGTELPSNSKFCNECGAAVATATTPAEYKQVTVLFEDVVHSMDIAAAVGPERLREIMTDLADRCAAVIRAGKGGAADGTLPTPPRRLRWRLVAPVLVATVHLPIEASCFMANTHGGQGPTQRPQRGQLVCHRKQELLPVDWG